MSPHVYIIAVAVATIAGIAGMIIGFYKSKSDFQKELSRRKMATITLRVNKAQGRFLREVLTAAKRGKLLTLIIS